MRDDDSGMASTLLNPTRVQFGEVRYVEGDEQTLFICRPLQLRLVALAQSTGLWRGNRVEAGSSQGSRDRTINIFVQEEPRTGH